MTIEQLEERFQKAADASFRARCVSEYKRIAGWVGKSFDWNAADILDFGCGEGYAAASIALRHPDARIYATDLAPVASAHLARKLEAQIQCGLPDNLQILPIENGTVAGDATFDLIFTWSVLEHIQEDCLGDILAGLKSRLRKGGALFVVCDPLYFSPRGSHLNKYFQEPWQHLTLSIDRLRSGVIRGAASDAASRDWQQFLELNRFTAPEILACVEQAGFTLKRSQLFRTEAAPSERLLGLYNADILTITGLQALFTNA